MVASLTIRENVRCFKSGEGALASDWRTFARSDRSRARERRPDPDAGEPGQGRRSAPEVPRKVLASAPPTVRSTSASHNSRPSASSVLNVLKVTMFVDHEAGTGSQSALLEEKWLREDAAADLKIVARSPDPPYGIFECVHASLPAWLRRWPRQRPPMPSYTASMLA